VFKSKLFIVHLLCCTKKILLECLFTE